MHSGVARVYARVPIPSCLPGLLLSKGLKPYSTLWPPTNGGVFGIHWAGCEISVSASARKKCMHTRAREF